MIIKRLSETSLDEATRLRDNVFTYLDKYEQETLDASLYADRFAVWYDEAGIEQLTYWVATDELMERVAGLVGLYTECGDNDDMIWLGWFCVDPEYRGQKIGEKLLEFAIEQAKEQGKKYLHLYTTDDPEYAVARTLYRKKGFVNYKVEGETLYYKLHINDRRKKMNPNIRKHTRNIKN